MKLAGPEVIPPPAQWIKVLDSERCIGCHACTTACKSENQVPLGVNRTYVKHVETGRFPDTRRHFQVTRCNQCADPPCVHACPVTAMYQREDGIVDFDKSACIGCKACIAACPYDAIFINPDDGSAEKCNLCAHKLDRGLEPACVTVCPAEAILIGDLSDPSAKVAELVGRESVAVRRPEKDTKPKTYYLGAEQATLDPLAATRPAGGLFMWSEQRVDPGMGQVGGGMPPGWASNNAAASLLAYDVNHERPWDFRVSLYTWTKSISAGVMLVTALAVVLGLLPPESLLATWLAPLIAGVFLALTGAVLIWDLTQPWRFFYIFLRPQWRSWLVRGAFIIALYGFLLVLWLYGALFGAPGLVEVLVWLSLPAALATAVYTAFLFAQAKARDLWQSPLLPFHMGLQALLAGSAVMGVAAVVANEPLFVLACAWALAVSAGLHVLVSLGEVALPKVTAHAGAAERQLTHGPYRWHYWGGLVAGAVVPVVLLALLPGGVGLVLASPLALAGLLAFEHAYVQAGQAVPLA